MPGRCAGSSKDDVVTPKKKNTTPCDQTRRREKQCSSEGHTNIVCNIRIITLNTPTFGIVSRAEHEKRA